MRQRELSFAEAWKLSTKRDRLIIVGTFAGAFVLICLTAGMFVMKLIIMWRWSFGSF